MKEIIVTNADKRFTFALLVVAHIAYFGFAIAALIAGGDWTGIIVGLSFYVVIALACLVWKLIMRIAYLIWPKD